MIRTCNPYQPLRIRCTLKDAIQHIAGPILIVVAANKELRGVALWQKPIAIVSALCTNRQTKSDQALYTRIAAAGT